MYTNVEEINLARESDGTIDIYIVRYPVVIYIYIYGWDFDRSEPFQRAVPAM
jgi:hypothetical protein